MSSLLKHALPLVATHGFTRTALARAVLDLPHPHDAPLDDTAVTALFGPGDDARRTLVHAWLDDARCRMKDGGGGGTGMHEVLKARLAANVPVLQHLPEAFALLATSSSVLPLDPSPVLVHAARVADQACWIAEPHADEAWYARRATVSGIYLAAELHQLTSPNTAEAFLEYLLDNANTAETVVREVSLYGSYILDSWKGIAKSRGLL